ncbi:MAG: hypothetical protein COS87_02390 [Chloroflexi bacterium CG07_land_8_20_14_0_80_45_17]|nr:MAG: hypothetical protein COS87_02390 [Chloroflexi bacterium CG07_land_8_20_14_0_80_45_17]
MKKWLSLIIAVCLVGVVFTGCASSESNAQETAQVTRGDLTISVSVSGNLEMPHKTDLSFGTTGMVAEVLVDEGDRVVKGQLLAKLEASSLELSVEMAQDRCEAAQVEYEMAENKLVQTIYPHYTSIYATDLPGAWLALEEAGNNLKEAQELLEQGKTEEAQALLELVESSITKAQKKSQSRTWAVPLSVKLAELQVDGAKAALDIAKLELAKARVELSKATITASFDGIVADIYINEGQQLSSMTYANPAICLIDPSEIKMNGVIDEIDISKVKLGQEADIILDALPDKEVKGRVTFISQAGTIQTGVVSYKTIITLENPDEELRDGMSATAEIILDRHENVLLIPNRAIQGSWDSPWVEVLANEQVEQRRVELGLSDGIKTEVLSGLAEGESVIFPESQLPFRMFGG